MKVTLLDLTDRDAPRRQLDEPERCKFVIAGNVDRLIMVVGHVSRYKYHANLLEKFCDIEQIACFWTKRPDQLQIVEDGWSIRGGGWLTKDIAMQQIKLFGTSRAYGRYDEDELALLISETGFFIGFETILKV